MSELASAILILWVCLFLFGLANALIRRLTGHSLLEAIGIAAIISRFFR